MDPAPSMDEAERLALDWLRHPMLESEFFTEWNRARNMIPAFPQFEPRHVLERLARRHEVKRLEGISPVWRRIEPPHTQRTTPAQKTFGF